MKYLFRSIPTVTLALALGASAVPCLAQTCGDLEQRLVDLAQRVEALEAKQPVAAKPAPAAPRPVAAAPVASDGREEALGLYRRVDNLVVQGQLEQARGELSRWDEQHAGTPSAGWTNALSRELAVVGKSAPTSWSIDHWFQGESEVQLDGKRPTLVVFWEVWCPHCREEVPKIEQIREQYGSRGLQVLGVTRITRTSTEDSVKAFLADNGVRYPMAKETGDLAEYFAVKGIPAAAIVKDGKIVWRGHPMRVTDELLTALF